MSGALIFASIFGSVTIGFLGWTMWVTSPKHPERLYGLAEMYEKKPTSKEKKHQFFKRV